MSPLRDLVPSVWHTLQRNPQVALRPPVTEITIQSVHEALGRKLPEALLEAYRCHNGQLQNGAPLFRDEYRGLGMQEALQEWRTWQDTMTRPSMTAMRHTHASCGDARAAVRMDWWNEHWWPLAISDLGDLLCVDGQPGPCGTLHQIIEVSSTHEDRSWVATSLLALFNHNTADLRDDLPDATSGPVVYIAAPRFASAGVENIFIADLFPCDPSSPLSCLEYAWNFGDGSTASGPHATHIYPEPGEYKVSLRVAGNDSQNRKWGPHETVEDVWLYPAEGSAWVNAATGGEVHTPAGAIVEIPAGALSSDAVVRLTHQSPSQFALPKGFVPLGEALIMDTDDAHLNGPINVSLPDVCYLPRGKVLAVFQAPPPHDAPNISPDTSMLGLGGRLMSVPSEALKGGKVNLSWLPLGPLMLGAVNDVHANYGTAANIMAPERAPAGVQITFFADLLHESACHQFALPEYAWDFGDGSTASGTHTTHTYSQPGKYQITLRIVEDAGINGSVGPYKTVNNIWIHPAETTAWVNATTGGEVHTPTGAIVEIPAGALSEDTVVHLTHRSTSHFDLPEGFAPLSEALVIDTTGAQLHGPINVSLPDVPHLPVGKVLAVFEVPHGPDAPAQTPPQDT